jgi:hypothetical protein
MNMSAGEDLGTGLVIGRIASWCMEGLTWDG